MGDDAKAEFFVMKEAVQVEMKDSKAKGAGSRWVFFDFITYVGFLHRHEKPMLLTDITEYPGPAVPFCTPIS